MVPVDLDCENIFGKTPLLWAAAKGHETVAKLLLAKDGVDPDYEDGFGQTPLCMAVDNGNETVVKLLLTQSRVDIDSKCSAGWTLQRFFAQLPRSLPETRQLTCFYVTRSHASRMRVKPHPGVMKRPT